MKTGLCQECTMKWVNAAPGNLIRLCKRCSKIGIEEYRIKNIQDSFKQNNQKGKQHE